MCKNLLTLYLGTSLLCGLISCSNSTDPKSFPPGDLHMVKAIVQAYDSLYNFSGLVLVGRGDSIIYQSAHGFADQDKRVANTLDTKFRLASLSKQFTAAALLILEQKQKVDFQKPVSHYLSDLKPELADRINIHQLLSHSSGLARDIESLTEEELGKTFISIDSLIQLINTSNLQFEPGKKWAYSNLGYIIAAQIIEQITGLSYMEALNNLIFEPLVMKNSGHESSTFQIESLAKGYVALPDSTIDAAYEDKSYVIGGGSIYASAIDLFTWSRALAKDGLLSKAQRDKLFSRQSGRYSYGWYIDTYVWPPVNDNTQAPNPHHEGGSPGFESKMSILTAHDMVVIILCNQLPSNLNGLSNRVINACLGFDESPPQADGSKDFFKTLFEQGVEATLVLTNKWQSTEKEFLIPNVDNVYLIGRGYMDAGDHIKAIRIMDYLIQVRPKWSYPYLFKAFMLESQGEIDKARALFAKVLEVQPGQSNALISLKRLDEKK